MYLPSTTDILYMYHLQAAVTYSKNPYRILLDCQECPSVPMPRVDWKNVFSVSGLECNALPDNVHPSMVNSAPVSLLGSGPRTGCSVDFIL